MQLIADMPVPNTLATPSVARLGISVASIEEFIDVRRANEQVLVLGEGSNVIAQAHIDTVVCLMRIRGFDVLEETSTHVVLRLGAGENWHQTVMRTLAQGWFGLENLALIPGSVGAAPVQNIGAYGVELARFVEGVTIVDEQARLQEIKRDSCAFDYRSSIFKLKRQWSIVGVTLRLAKQPDCVTSYPDVQAELEARQISEPTPVELADVVIAVRQRKLPDPKEIPNAGSFFKNPVVPVAVAEKLRASIPDLSTYPQGDAIKLSAAQLIDRAGWKGRQRGEIRCWHLQPLVLVNPAHQDAADILAFAEDIRRDISARYGVELEPEPSLLF